MRQEKWDKLHKELDDALEAEFGSVQSIFENARLVLREHITANKEQVARDLQEMREKSITRDLTLEEAAEEFYSEQSKAYEDEIEPMFDISRYLVSGFIEGAKWQQKRNYSEEEVKAIVNKVRETGLTVEYLLLTEQFKKK